MKREAEDLGALRERLRASGLRATAARVAVLRSLVQARGPLSHAEFCERLAGESFDRATIYRNLVDLADAGIVRRSDIGDHVWRFELAPSGDAHEKASHPHFVCSDCGKLECVPLDAIALKAVRGAPRALLRDNLEIHLRGRCDACS